MVKRINGLTIKDTRMIKPVGKLVPLMVPLTINNVETLKIIETNM